MIFYRPNTIINLQHPLNLSLKYFHSFLNSIQKIMSRGNVFKLSGNLALGSTPDTYSTSELQSIKSSLRLLKARQSQKKSQQNIDINNNYGISYSSNTGQRSDLKRNENPKDYNYFQSNAKNHVPSYDNGYGYEQKPVGRMNSKTSIYENERGHQNRDRNGNLSSMTKNDYTYNEPQRNDFKNNYNQASRNNDYSQGSKNNDYGQGVRNEYNQGSRNNNYNSYGYNDGSMMKEQSARNPVKTRAQDLKLYNNEQHYDQKPLPNHKNYEEHPAKNNPQTRPPLRKQQLNQQASSYNAPVQNQHQEKSLKAANRQKKQEIVEYDPATFVQCSVGCGRKFNPDSISKHEAICYKVFQKKRKQFNAQQQRVLDENHNKILKKTVVEERRGQTKKPSGKPSKNDDKMSKWKAQSLAFRAMLKQNKGSQVSAEEQRQLEQIKNVGMVKCPTCGRSFNENAGPKHIAFCEAQNKKNKMKR